MTGEPTDLLSRDARDRIAQAIGVAEAGTAGEIVVLVAARAGRYRSAPLLLALACSLAAPWPLILLTAMSAASIALTQAALGLAVLMVCAHPRIAIALVPRAIRRARAHEAAIREFTARGLTRTQGRTGVLVYLTVAEGYAEIVADHGVAKRVPAEVWADAIAALLTSLRQGKPEDGLIAAVRQVGAILAETLPPEAQPANALPNRVIVVP